MASTSKIASVLGEEFDFGEIHLVKGMRTSILGGILVLVFSSVLYAQGNRSFVMKGIVSGDGNRINAAFVLIRDYQSPAPGYGAGKWQTETESDGTFSVLIQPGCFDIFISATLYTPYSKRFCIEANHPPLFKIKMKKDPHLRLKITDR